MALSGTAARIIHFKFIVLAEEREASKGGGGRMNFSSDNLIPFLCPCQLPTFKGEPEGAGVFVPPLRTLRHHNHADSTSSSHHGLYSFVTLLCNLSPGSSRLLA